MDIQTSNQEEFDKLHPSMKDYLFSGMDTNRYASNLVTEKNFFNMNLFKEDPEELDPDLIARTEAARADPNYFFEGVKYVFDAPNWVTEEQYESDMADHYDPYG